eukprot:TRINITY_DN40642_c0_g1_i1.p1 TRINITY_DN40642_c0_g1~~TRINITY_DN40642_c0_g1_i1.p1  ORF type:complete len:206 (+),score=21.71 TRINITY_DN40642_c0_g1_i1:58-675(+)
MPTLVTAGDLVAFLRAGRGQPVQPVPERRSFQRPGNTAAIPLTVSALRRGDVSPGDVYVPRRLPAEDLPCEPMPEPPPVAPAPKLGVRTASASAERAPPSAATSQRSGRAPGCGVAGRPPSSSSRLGTHRASPSPVGTGRHSVAHPRVSTPGPRGTPRGGYAGGRRISPTRALTRASPRRGAGVLQTAVDAHAAPYRAAKRPPHH